MSAEIGNPCNNNNHHYCCPTIQKARPAGPGAERSKPRPRVSASVVVTSGAHTAAGGLNQRTGCPRFHAALRQLPPKPSLLESTDGRSTTQSARADVPAANQLTRQ